MFVVQDDRVFLVFGNRVFRGDTLLLCLLSAMKGEGV